MTVLDHLVKYLPLLALLLIPSIAWNIVIRHDVDDKDHIALARNYPATCHFPDGEGTLIAPSWIVTAAHVAEGLQHMMNRGDTPVVECGSERYQIGSIILHPEFKPIVHDIALVRLTTPVQDVKPVSINTKAENGAMITIVGRGDFGTGLTGPRTMDRINRAATNRIDGTDEHWIWFDFDNPHSTDVTPLEGISGPGDSGGPAFIEIEGMTFLAGVSSHQRGEGPPGRYGVVEYYTRVSAYADWIRSHITW